MRKRFTVIPVALCLLAGCTPGYEQRAFPALPDEMKDCKFYRLNDGGGSAITVARCPNSITSTTYSQGKNNTVTTVVIDGTEYVKKGTP